MPLEDMVPQIASDLAGPEASTQRWVGYGTRSSRSGVVGAIRSSGKGLAARERRRVGRTKGRDYETAELAEKRGEEKYSESVQMEGCLQQDAVGRNRRCFNSVALTSTCVSPAGRCRSLASCRTIWLR